MQLFLRRISFFLEALLNGSYILLFTLNQNKKIPHRILSEEQIQSYLDIGAYIVPIVILVVLIINYLKSENLQDFLRKYVFSLIVFVPLLLTLGDQEFSYWLVTVHLFSSFLSLYEIDQNKTKDVQTVMEATFLYKLKMRPAQFVILSFIGLILFGTVLLILPVASPPGKSLSLIDALFMSTSAVCVTGLASVSVADQLSLFGQLVLLALIQMGGLGIMTLYSSMTIFLGKNMAMRHRVVMQDVLDIGSMADLITMIVNILKYTFFIELWGVVVLTIGFSFEGYEFGQALYFGFFHAISAFCNAGFGLLNNSLESYASSPLISGTISVLIILGGLGFIVLKEIKQTVVERKPYHTMTVHSRLAINTTFILITIGAFYIFFSEYMHGLDSFDLLDKIQVAFFQSVTTRTAGFNSVGLNSFYSHTLYFMCILMFIGGSPGSTAGGIKTTTFAILIQSVRSTLRGRPHVEFFKRKVPSQLVVTSTSIVIISLMMISFFLLVIMKVETQQTFLTLFFESISAFGTVGLSLGLTPYLTVAGKLVIITLMYIGRVGPLTLALAIGQKSSIQGALEYPETKIMIG
ncbi:MAG: hypothetical protein JNM93_00615 [Bacteriovoracaceae bacterium]|nr:hypothetical protein [Bacteriovoracaceae bacterium]